MGIPIKRKLILYIPLFVILLFGLYQYWARTRGELENEILPKGVKNIIVGISFEEFSKRVKFSYDVNKPFNNPHEYNHKDYIVFEAKGVNGFSLISFHFRKKPSVLYRIEAEMGSSPTTPQDFENIVAENTQKYGRPRRYTDDPFLVARWRDPATEMEIIFDKYSKKLSFNYQLRKSPPVIGAGD